MKKSVLYFSVLLFVASVFTSCDEDYKEEAVDSGKKAAVEFCDCYEDNSKDHCLNKLKSNYSSYYMSDDFINAFNSKSSCGIKLEKVQVQK